MPKEKQKPNVNHNSSKETLLKMKYIVWVTVNYTILANVYIFSDFDAYSFAIQGCVLNCHLIVKTHPECLVMLECQYGRHFF